MTISASEVSAFLFLFSVLEETLKAGPLWEELLADAEADVVMLQSEEQSLFPPA